MSTTTTDWTAITAAVQTMKAGTALPWEDRRSQFVASLPELDAAASHAVAQVLPWLDGMTDEERAATFRGEELDTALVNLASGYAPDPQEWYAYVRETGQSWDGRAESWDQFSEWFRYYAYEPGFGAYAEDLMADLGGRTNPERLAALAEFGVVLPIADPETPWSEEPEDGRVKRGGGRGGGGTSVHSTSKHDSTSTTLGGERGGSSIGGTGGDDGGDDGRKRELDKTHEKDDTPIKRRRSGRHSTAADLTDGTLTVTWHRTGDVTQRLDQVQAMGFHQTATLTRPDGSVRPVHNLYAFYQEVRDTFSTHTGETEALGAFEQDKSFKPPYGGESTVRDDESITFTDDPGWSGDTLVGAGQWITSYTIHFRWRVRHHSTDQEWVSPTQTHTLTCPYTDGSPTPIAATPDGTQSWPVTFPPLDEEEEDD